jgi:fatty acid kinase fatty acid binding subunit
VRARACACGSAWTRWSTCGAAGASAQRWIGSALKIKPILALEREITPVERVRTAGRAFERMVEYMEALEEAGRDGWAIQHIRAPDQAQRLADRGRHLFGSEPLFVSEVGPVIGAHVGPGLLGVGGVARDLVRA